MGEHELFRLLVERTRVLATVCDNAAVVLSEEFESMVSIPLSNVQEVLKMCPQYEQWAGDFKDSDITVEYFRHDSQKYGPDQGVKMRHVPTDLGVESYSKGSREENEAIARRALQDRVKQRWERQQGLETPAIAPKTSN